MDPRFKMKLVEFSFTKIYGGEAHEFVKIVDGRIHELLNEYAVLYCHWLLRLLNRVQYFHGRPGRVSHCELLQKVSYLFIWSSLVNFNSERSWTLWLVRAGLNSDDDTMLAQVRRSKGKQLQKVALSKLCWIYLINGVPVLIKGRKLGYIDDDNQHNILAPSSKLLRYMSRRRGLLR